jgi:hypothetical protein
MSAVRGGREIERRVGVCPGGLIVGRHNLRSVKVTAVQRPAQDLRKWLRT